MFSLFISLDVYIYVSIIRGYIVFILIGNWTIFFLVEINKLQIKMDLVVSSLSFFSSLTSVLVHIVFVYCLLNFTFNCAISKIFTYILHCDSLKLCGCCCFWYEITFNLCGSRKASNTVTLRCTWSGNRKCRCCRCQILFIAVIGRYSNRLIPFIC